MAEEESFVHRWSRRKSEAGAPARRSEPATLEALGTPPAAPPAPAEARAVDAAEAVDPLTLPDIESLTYEFDFTVFLRPGVPSELRKRALQQLWRSDPVLANLDGLVEYGEDYSRIGMVKQVVRTAYQVGRGMLDRIEAEPAPGEPPPASEVAVAEPAAIAANGGEDALAGEAGDALDAPSRPSLKGQIHS